MFTQNTPAARMRGQLDDVLPGQNNTSGGSSDNEVNEPTAKPTGPAWSAAVMTVTPVGKCPSVWRYCAWSKRYWLTVAPGGRRRRRLVAERRRQWIQPAPVASRKAALPAKGCAHRSRRSMGTLES